MKTRNRRSSVIVTLALAVAVGVCSAVAVLWSLGGVLYAGAGPAGELHVCPSGCAYSSVQAAVDAASPGDVIKVAEGTYTDIHVRAGITQVVYVSKTVTIAGGYTTTNWSTPDPIGQVTTLDAEGQGRVLVVSDTTGVTLQGLAITGGDATGLLGSAALGTDAGGGICAFRALSLTLKSCDIFSNSAHMTSRCCGMGGGLYLLSSHYALVEENSFRGNWGNQSGRGDGGGAAMHFSDHVILRSNTIADNIGDDSNGLGGGLYLERCHYAVLDENVVSGNTASASFDARGGGAYLQSAFRAHLTDNVFENNVASRLTWGHGGGLYLASSRDVTLDRNVFVGNATSSNPSSTGYAGGGLYLVSSDGAIMNTVLVDNYAGAFGSGIYMQDSSPRLLHTTLARNTGGDGSAIYVTDEYGPHGWPSFTNTIIFSHTVGISVTAGNSATLNGTLWYGNGSTTGGAGAIDTGTINVYGDPAFDLDGYHLAEGSAAIDAGVDSGVMLDVDGDPRPRGAGYDIGADEVSRWAVFLPLVFKAR